MGNMFMPTTAIMEVTIIAATIVCFFMNIWECFGAQRSRGFKLLKISFVAPIRYKMKKFVAKASDMQHETDNISILIINLSITTLTFIIETYKKINNWLVYLKLFLLNDF